MFSSGLGGGTGYIGDPSGRTDMRAPTPSAAKEEKVTDIGKTFPAEDFAGEFILRKGKKVFIKIELS